MSNEQLELPGMKNRNVMTIDKSMKLALALQKWMADNKTNKISQKQLTNICKDVCGFYPQLRSVRTIMNNVGLSFLTKEARREFKGRTSEGLPVVLARVMLKLVDTMKTAANEEQAVDSWALNNIREALRLMSSHRSSDEILDALNK